MRASMAESKTISPSTREAQQKAGLLSVIVPVYNLEGYLEECVRSILDQTYKDLEVLLVDDGSTDGSGALCDRMKAQDNRVRVWHTENNGRAAARNLALSEAAGEWIGFVDGDDWVDKDMYASLIGLCRKEKAQIGQCTFNYVFPDRTASDGDDGRVAVYTMDEALDVLPEQGDVRFEVALKVFHRSAVEKVRFVPGQLFEEIHFTRLALYQMERFVSLRKAYYQYRQRREGNTNSSFSPAKLKILPECDGFIRQLREEGRTVAADGMEAFTLDMLIRLYVNAAANRADRETLNTLKSAYRARFRKAGRNPKVRKLRGMLFALSPELYDTVSARLHKREG